MHKYSTCLLPYDIEYAAHNGLTVTRVVFERWNDAAKINERVSIHWTEAFKWADADRCGGLGVCAVQLSDGTEAFATGRYFNEAHPRNQGQHGLCDVVVGAYGTSWLKRVLRPVAAAA